MTWRVNFGIFLIVLGGLALLGTLGFLEAQAWSFIIAAALILGGALLLWSARPKPRMWQTVAASAPLENATRATIQLKHGTGQLTLRGGASADLLFVGAFVGGITQKISRDGDAAAVELKTPVEQWAQRSLPKQPQWDIQVNSQCPLTLRYEGGAGQARLNCADIQLTTLDIQAGASAMDIILPEPRGALRVAIHSGAATVKLRVPPDARVAIHGAPGLGLLDADTTRFHEHGAGILQSDGYAETPDHIEIIIESGIGAVEIR